MRESEEEAREAWKSQKTKCKPGSYKRQRRNEVRIEES